MMIGVDIETDKINRNDEEQRLDFIIGCIVNEKGKGEFFYKPEDMWNKILDIGYKLNKQNKNLYVYAHNHDFDFQGYADKTDENIEYLKLERLIANYKFRDIKNSSKIIFLDTMLIHNKSLKSMGEFISIPKLEWDFEDKNTIDKLNQIKKDIRNNNESKLLKEFKEYNANDAIIVIEFIKKIKQYLKNDGFKTRRLMTIGLISKNYFAKMLKVVCPEIFENLERGRFKQFDNKTKEFIHQAYRAGRNEVYKIGDIKKVTEIDLNSSYPYSLINIEIPVLDSYVHIYDTNKIMKKTEVLKNIGVSRVILKIKRDLDLPLLPVRTSDGVVYPNKKDDIILANYTHKELELAEKEGYKIMYILETVMFKRNFKENPFKKIVEDIFEKRKRDEFANYLYKNILNNFVGKLAQRNKKRSVRFASEYNRNKLEKQGYKAIRQVEGDNKYIFEKKGENWEYSGFYCPIIAAYVNANSRILLYNELKKVDKDDRLLCNTDSIILKNFDKYKSKFKFDNNIGNWKIKKENVDMKIYSRNQYRIDKDIRVSGVHSQALNKKNFEEGVLEFTNKMGILENNRNGIKFNKIERDLKRSADKELIKEEKQMIKKYYIEGEIPIENKQVIVEVMGL